MKRLSQLFLVIFLALLFVTCKMDGYYNYSLKLAHIMDSLNIDESTIEILIDKSDFKLTLQSEEHILKEYPVVFGGNPTEDKRMEGDQCTPEGNFKMVSRYPHKSWSKFIWINYPTSESWKKYKKAKSELKIPETATIGGEIGIHGVPEGMDHLIDLKSNWTLGCISMKNKDVNEIYPYISAETKIHIRK